LISLTQLASSLVNIKLLNTWFDIILPSLVLTMAMLFSPKLFLIVDVKMVTR
jgi:hypothetical protein